MACEKSKILVIGGTGYFGKYIVKASLSLGHPTYVYVRPIKSNSDPSKIEVRKEFSSLGVTILQGELEDHEKLVSALKQVDIVISTVASPQHHDQLKIIDAIKEAGNIKRFVPSEFGVEVDRASGLPSFEPLLDEKRKIRRAVEASGIPYTHVCGNSFAAYFVDFLLHPLDSSDEIVVYGNGEARAVLNYEEDLAIYSIKAATDPRLVNRLFTIRPQQNIVSQLDLISSWENTTGRTFKRIHVPEEEIVRLSETLPFPEDIRMGIVHNIFVKGDQMSFELSPDDQEATELYPDHKFTSIHSFLARCLVNYSKPKLAALG